MKKKDELPAVIPSGLPALPGGGFSLDLPRPFSREIFLAEVTVAGCNYVRGINKRLGELKKGDRVILRREPKNEHDELAILVKMQDNRKLGYVPRRENQVLARLMDAGKMLYGVVSYVIDPETDFFSWKALRIEIYMED